MKNEDPEKPKSSSGSIKELSIPLGLSKGNDYKFDLSNKKSERTTFKLSEESIKSLEWLANHGEVKIKEVIDLAIEHWMDNLIEAKEEWPGQHTIFQKLITSREKFKARKTYVISLGAIRLLNNLSLNFKIKRDIIMETIIIDYAHFIRKYEQKKLPNYQLALNKLLDFAEKIEGVCADIKALVGKDDPITEYVYYATSHIVDDAIPKLEKVVEEGRPLKPRKIPKAKIPKTMLNMLNKVK
ncbi:MAG: hypothetical protein WBW55_04110 [Desulfobaccales bacterium]